MDVADLFGVHACRELVAESRARGVAVMIDAIAVRYAPGVVSESQRQVHMAEKPSGNGLPQSWLTFCGAEIPAQLAEVSEKPAGMPCMGCLTRITPS